MRYLQILGSVLMFTLSGHAMARIGQTEDEVNALFGKPIDPGKPDADGVTTNMYKNPTGQYLALVQFAHGHSVAESYARVDNQPLSEKELSAFLQGNSGGKEWTKDPTKLAWERSDHRVKAWCETLAGRPTLLVQVK